MNVPRRPRTRSMQPSAFKLRVPAAINAFAIVFAAIGLANAAENALDKFIGTWVGTWPRVKATIEFRVDRIDQNNNVYGMYCHIHSTWSSFSDIHPKHGIPAKVQYGRILWRQHGRRWSFSVQRRDEERLRMELWTREGIRKRLNLFRQSPNFGSCLWRVSAPDGEVQ